MRIFKQTKFSAASLQNDILLKFCTGSLTPYLVWWVYVCARGEEKLRFAVEKWKKEKSEKCTRNEWGKDKVRREKEWNWNERGKAINTEIPPFVTCEDDGNGNFRRDSTRLRRRASLWAKIFIFVCCSLSKVVHFVCTLVRPQKSRLYGGWSCLEKTF